jgi:hypothetical protein
MATTYRVVIDGVSDGLATVDVVLKLATLCKIPPTRAGVLLITPRTILKRAVDLETARRYQAALQSVGCKTFVEKEAEIKHTTTQQSPGSSAGTTNKPTLPSSTANWQPNEDQNHLKPNAKEVGQYLSALVREGKNTIVAIAKLARQYAAQAIEKVRSVRKNRSTKPLLRVK